MKTPRNNIHIQGDIPSRILDMLRREYGGELRIYEGEEEYLEVMESDWYKGIKAKTTPGDAMRIYRKNQGEWGQANYT